MYRIDVTSAVPDLPAPAASGTPGYFTDGDVVAGLPATVLPADFMNMLQEEFMSILAAAGVLPSKVNHGQLLAAMQVLFASMSAFTASFGATGYVKFPNGLIIQWGFNTLLPNQAISTIAYLVAFPNAALWMGASAGYLLSPLNVNQPTVGAGAKSATEGYIAVAGSTAGATGVSWLAIGF